MRLLRIGEKIKKNDEVNVQPFTGKQWPPIWEKVTCFVGWKVIEGTYGKYRRLI
jgi:hypothetical protein